MGRGHGLGFGGHDHGAFEMKPAGLEAERAVLEMFVDLHGGWDFVKVKVIDGVRPQDMWLDGVLDPTGPDYQTCLDYREVYAPLWSNKYEEVTE